MLQLYQSLQARVLRFLQRWAAFLVAPLLALHCRFLLARQQRFAVPRRTLASLFRQLRIARVHLLKVDTEGAEAEVLPSE